MGMGGLTLAVLLSIWMYAQLCEAFEGLGWGGGGCPF
jgi:hypothetical protein